MTYRAIRISSFPFITLTAGEEKANQYDGQLADLPSATTLFLDDGCSPEILAQLPGRTTTKLGRALHARLCKDFTFAIGKHVGFLVFTPQNVTGYLTSAEGKSMPVRFEWRNTTRARHFVPPVLQPLTGNRDPLVSCVRAFQRAVPSAEVIGLWGTAPLSFTKRNLESFETPCVIIPSLTADLEGALLLAEH